jgi:hypothetical protein
MLALAGMVALASTGSLASANNCPADLTGDRVVGGADLGSLLAGWGQPGPTDIDGNGITDGADLGILLAAWGACPAPSPTTFVGVVILADGTPLSGAVVVTNLGGTATTGTGGDYELSLMLDGPPASVTLTAVATIDGTTYQGSAVVGKVALGDLNEVDPIVVSPQASCSGGYAWLPGLGTPGVSGLVGALTVFDDGTGPALYVGGNFTDSGGVAANRIARWDGTAWSPLGSGLNDRVHALTVFDDGTGPALYAGGWFITAGGVAANNIARWNGAEWSPLGSGVSNAVLALTVFDDGTGPALYAGGFLSFAGGVPANRIARWNGTAWSALGAGISGGGVLSELRALAVFDDGAGAALYAGGRFTAAGGVTVNGIARWNGSAWSALGAGMSGGLFELAVNTLTVFDNGTGPALYAGGDFSNAGGVAANNIARWDGTAWSPLGSGMNDRVYALTVFDDGTGPALYAGGQFSSAGGISANRIARWNGTAWSPFGSGVSGGSSAEVRALTLFDDGTGAALYAGGVFTAAGGVGASSIAGWDGTAWTPLGSGMNGMNGGVHALTIFDDGAGPALYAGGEFTTAGGVTVNRIARWDGTVWSSLGSGVNGWVGALAIFDDGGGPALYAGGSFTTAGGVAANNIARWNGTAWSHLGSGMNFGVLALTVFDDGTGPALHAGGWFTTAGGVAANNIARWNGAEWSPLGSGVSNAVLALTVFDDGAGPALYAGGWFTAAGGVAANNIARWNGTAWSHLGSGMGGPSPAVHSLTVFDDGTGPALYAGGWFTAAGGVAASRIARWDGSAWSPLGSGVVGGAEALTVFNDGTGPALYAGGAFTSQTVLRIARWDGTAWSPLGSGLNDWVYALTVFDDGTGPALYAGGQFTTAGGVGASNIAKWGCVD